MKTTNLEDHLQQLRSELQEYTVRLQNQEHTERELTDKAKDQERQLQIANGSLITIRKEAEKHRRRVRELEEQIQSDDRVERLEASVKNTQDRADDLEFQLSKLKQVSLSKSKLIRPFIFTLICFDSHILLLNPRETCRTLAYSRSLNKKRNGKPNTPTSRPHIRT
ncbi:hypothetical protein FB446DRAFT_334110 [Lentinula raphanica]|nr:hypothetical protein FB446DRAFT_334110 [Lentinula raphanica]